ncbi:MAG: FtsX-like permease family protein, partial [Bdellovibrionota bacterium]
VQSAVPVIEARAWVVDGHGKREGVVVLGVDLLQEKTVRKYSASADKKIVGDSLSFISQPDSAILSESFARLRGLKINDPIELTTAKGKSKFIVRGLLQPTGVAKAYGGGMVILDIDAARIQFGKEGRVDRVDVVPTQSADVARIAADIRKIVGPGLTVERPELQTEQTERMLRSFQAMLRFFSTLALIVGVFLISNSVAITIAERKKEIGSLRAIGVTRLSILLLFVSESIVSGLVGALAGAFLGRGMASIMLTSVRKALSEQNGQPIPVTELTFGLEHIGNALLIGFVAAVFASFWPALKTLSIQPIDAMKRQENEEPTGFGFSVRYIWKWPFYRVAPWLGGILMTYSVAISLGIEEVESRWLEGSAQLGAVIGAAFLGPVFFRKGAVLLQRWVSRRGSFVTRLAFDNLLKNARRTSSNVMTLVVGLIMVIMMSAVNKSFKATIAGWYAKVLQADLIVSSTGKMASHESQQLDESIRARFEAINGVAGAYGLRYTRIRYQAENLGLKAFDEPPYTKPGMALYDVQDRPVEEAVREFFAAKDPVVMVSKSFVKNFKVKTGEKILLPTPKGIFEFRVVAIVVDFITPAGVIYMPRKQYVDFFSDRLVSAYGLQLVPGTDRDLVRKEINSGSMEDVPLTVISNEDVRRDVEKTIDESFAYTKTVEAAALFVALFGLLNTLLVSVLERTREIGMMRAIGMSKGQLYRMIFTEAAVLGALSSFAAAVMGAGLGALWVIKSLPHVLGWILDFYFPWLGIAVTVAMGFAVAMIAAWYPAHRASAMVISEAIDYE